METVNLTTTPGIAKVVGVILCMAGVAILALYKGPHLKPLLHHHLFKYHNSPEHHAHVPYGKEWIKGCFLAFIGYITWGLWLVLQGPVLKSYPSKLFFASLQCILSTLQSFVVAIAVERNLDQWKLGWNVKLLAVAYCGIMSTGVGFYVQAWVIEKKGPVFLAMSTPLCLVMTIFCSYFLLGEIISLGSVLGGIFLVGSLYSVLWGKSKEKNPGCLPVESQQECIN